MSESSDTQEPLYKVVKNHEEQYSIWLAYKPNPAGWVDGGKTGSKPECLAFIGEVWTDMRPLSLRKALDAAGARQVVPISGLVEQSNQG
jgi:MbtH protein